MLHRASIHGSSTLMPGCAVLNTGPSLVADSSHPIPVTKQDIEDHFSTHGAGTIKEVKLMNGFGFIEYEDAMDARDVVPGTSNPDLHLTPQLANSSYSFPYAGLAPLPLSLVALPDNETDGTEFKGERLTVQFARGPRRKDDFSGPPDRNVPRPRRTIYRMQITGLQPETSWQVGIPVLINRRTHTD